MNAKISCPICKRKIGIKDTTEVSIPIDKYHNAFKFVCNFCKGDIDILEFYPELTSNNN